MVSRPPDGSARSLRAEPALPLLTEAATRSAQPVAWCDGQPVSRARFLADVAALAARLPDRRHAINLCQHRYNFLVAFCAVAVRGQSSLLPTSRLESVVAETAAAFPGCYRLGDADLRDGQGDGGPAAARRPPSGAARPASAASRSGADSASGPVADDPPAAMPVIGADDVVAVAFTSGSTGASQPCPKRWGELVTGARLAVARFGFALHPGATVVATVPPQHMYGLETSVMLPLADGVALHAGRPFFAADIAQALASVPPPRLLVTTPAHLRVAVAAGIPYPPVALVISATAPLSRRLARAAEALFAAPVMEIYGYTEAGSIASRRTVADDAWTLYDGMRIADGRLEAPHLPAAVPFNDVIEPRPDGRFLLLGRRQDLINIAGKRTSLAHLNAVLADVEGVVDGVFVMPDEDGDRPGRLAALVVAPGVDRRRILAALAQRLDPLFLPRPLVAVDHLPRGDTGKLPRQVLLDLLRRARAEPGGAGGGGGAG
jgi:acyl-coenzyme A synthetase/AMP-(fatty) acid ligase